MHSNGSINYMSEQWIRIWPILHEFEIRPKDYLVTFYYTLSILYLSHFIIIRYSDSHCSKSSRWNNNKMSFFPVHHQDTVQLWTSIQQAASHPVQRKLAQSTKWQFIKRDPTEAENFSAASKFPFKTKF